MQHSDEEKSHRATLRNLRMGRKGKGGGGREGRGQKEGDYMATRKICSQGMNFAVLAQLLKLGRMFLQEVTAQPSLNLALGFHCNAIPWIWKSHGIATASNIKSKTMMP